LKVENFAVNRFALFRGLRSNIVRAVFLCSLSSRTGELCGGFGRLSLPQTQNG
jgi:hypothetical protein